MLASLTIKSLAILTLQLQLCLFPTDQNHGNFRGSGSTETPINWVGQVAVSHIQEQGVQGLFKTIWQNHCKQCFICHSSPKNHNAWHTYTVKSSNWNHKTNGFLFCALLKEEEAKHNEINQYLVSSDSEFNILQLITSTIHTDPRALQSHQS